jgi:magnesium transporter
MIEFAGKVSARAGLLSGAAARGAETEETRIMVLDYDLDHLNEFDAVQVEDCVPFRDTKTVTWINVEGLQNEKLIEDFGERFGLHALHLEDILDTSGRPKIEDYGDYILVVLKMLYSWGENAQIVSEHVSLVIGRNYLISFQESRGDVFDPIRKVIRNNKGRVRKEGPDYLSYLLVDAIVDGYFKVMENLGEFVEDTEEVVLNKPERSTIHDIHELKTEMLYMRKAVIPLREIVGELLRGGSELVSDSTQVHFRDVYDHVIHIMDILDTYRDIISSMLDTYLTSLSNRMNEIMKVLTIFATIFIPLTFLAGVYGMNFKYFPELEWRWSYPLFWFVAVLITLGLLRMFKKKRWI